MYYTCIVNNWNKLILSDFNCIVQHSLYYAVYRYLVTLCIGQLHPTIVYGTGFGMSAILVLSVIMCPFY